jgi:hypothetical protein
MNDIFVTPAQFNFFSVQAIGLWVIAYGVYNGSAIEALEGVVGGIGGMVGGVGSLAAGASASATKVREAATASAALAASVSASVALADATAYAVDEANADMVPAVAEVTQQLEETPVAAEL